MQHIYHLNHKHHDWMEIRVSNAELFEKSTLWSINRHVDNCITSKKFHKGILKRYCDWFVPFIHWTIEDLFSNESLETNSKRNTHFFFQRNTFEVHVVCKILAICSGSQYVWKVNHVTLFCSNSCIKRAMNIVHQYNTELFKKTQKRKYREGRQNQSNVAYFSVIRCVVSMILKLIVSRPAYVHTEYKLYQVREFYGFNAITSGRKHMRYGCCWPHWPPQLAGKYN